MVGKEVFYAALWGSVLVSPSIRLPASLFVVGHISRDSPGREQKYMLGTDYQLTVGACCSQGKGACRAQAAPQMWLALELHGTLGLSRWRRGNLVPRQTQVVGLFL